MVHSDKQEDRNNRQIEDVDRVDSTADEEDSSTISSGDANISAGENPSIIQRLKEIFVENDDGDLLLQQSFQGDGILQWLRALDKQVLGACRADERLKPLLKLNISTDATDDCLFAHLSQHFAPSEVAMLASCLCLPLVSIRVGKITKQGTLLCPTSIRGSLYLTLLPTLDLRISFTGDDGCKERLATLSTDAQCSAVEIEEISADKSGRSFLIKIPDGEIFYFWCCEKSKLLGNELLRKMKDLLTRKPSLAKLTGICESRFNCFARHLQAYIAGSMMTSARASSILSAPPSLHDSIDSSESNDAQTSFASQRTSQFGVYDSQGTKTNQIYEGSLWPRPSSFIEGLPRSLSSLSVAQEKLRQREESCISCLDNLNVASPSCADPSSTSYFKDKLSEATGTPLFPSFSFLDAPDKSEDLPLSGPKAQISSSDHNCWFPPVAAALKLMEGTSQLPILSTESLSLPPLSSLLKTAGQSSLLTSKSPLNLDRLLTSKSPFNLDEVLHIDFPPLLPEPLVKLPQPLHIPTSHQIPTFTPLTCDPIVRIPVIEVCSSGQGYLLSAPPTISTTMPSLSSDLPDVESAVEKGARETLRLLISRSSNQPNPQLLDVLPSLLASSNNKQNTSVARNKSLYSGTRDVVSVSSSATAMEGIASKRFNSRGKSVDQTEEPGDLVPCSFDDYCFNLRDESTD